MTWIRTSGLDRERARSRAYRRRHSFFGRLRNACFAWSRTSHRQLRVAACGSRCEGTELQEAVLKLGLGLFRQLSRECLLCLAFLLGNNELWLQQQRAIGEILKQAAQKKTLGRMALGINRWMTAVTKGVLCNWMVTIGVVLALISRSTIGKIAAMWLPIMTFFAQGKATNTPSSTCLSYRRG